MRRVVASILVACVVSAIAATGVYAHNDPTSTHTFGDCHDLGSDPNATHGFNFHRLTSGGDPGWDGNTGVRYTAARGRIYAQRLDPCIDGDDDHVSKSLILAANMQGTGTDGDYNFVQAGIGKINYEPGRYQCAGNQRMVDDQTSFIYTPIATMPSDGIFCRAEFVDFNNDGVVDNPVANTWYTFTIEMTTVGGAAYYRFTIKRDSDGAYDTKLIPRTSASSLPEVWWGCEVGNTANQLGTFAANPDMKINQPAYRKAGSSTWYYTEDSPIHQPWYHFPSGRYYNYWTDQSGTGESFWCDTYAHSNEPY